MSLSGSAVNAYNLYFGVYDSVNIEANDDMSTVTVFAETYI